MLGMASGDDVGGVSFLAFKQFLNDTLHYPSQLFHLITLYFEIKSSLWQQPRFGGEVIPHQDSSFLYTDPPSVTGLWLALEDACIENGCLYILPRSHVHGIHRRFYEQEDGKQGYDKPAQEYKIEDFVPLEVPAGTLVVLHGAVVHFSEENTSPKSRHAYTVHYIDAESRWDEANWWGWDLLYLYHLYYDYFREKNTIIGILPIERFPFIYRMGHCKD